MSGGFFRGTSADQDTRFSNKQAKLLKSQKFAPELDHLVDMRKVKVDVIKPWIANRATELLGFEDEVLINFIYGLLDGKEVDGKQIQIQLTGFMEKNTGKFMKELWSLLLSAEKNVSGVPQQFLDAKEEETRKKKVETDRITNEIQKKREKEGRETEQEKHKKLDIKDDSVAALDHSLARAPSVHPEEEREAGERHGSRPKGRHSESPHSENNSPSRRSPPSETRSDSKSFSNSRSYSDERYKSRSISRSPPLRRRSVSPERRYHSPQRRSISPGRKRSPWNPRSSSKRKSPYSRRRSTSLRRSPSPGRRRSPRMRRGSPSPLRRRSPSPLQRRSPIRDRRRSPSPRRRFPSPRWRSPSPLRRRSPSPLRRRMSPSPHRSPSPLGRRRSPSPHWSPSPLRRRRRSPSPRLSPSPLAMRRRPPSPRQSPPPLRKRRSPSPRRSPPPLRRRRSPSPRQSLSPLRRRRSPSPLPLPQSPRHRRRSPVPPRRHAMESRISPQKRNRSLSTERDTRANGVESRRHRDDFSSQRSRGKRSPPLSRADEREAVEHPAPGHKALDSLPRRPPISLRSPQRVPRDQGAVRQKSPVSSPSPADSPSNSGSPSQVRRMASPSVSPMRNARKRPTRHDIPETTREEETSRAREVGSYKDDSSQKRNKHSPLADGRKKAPVKGSVLEEDSSNVTAVHRSSEARGNSDHTELRKTSRSDNNSRRMDLSERRTQLATSVSEEIEYGPGGLEGKRSSRSSNHDEQPSTKKLPKYSSRDEMLNNEAHPERTYSKENYRVDEKKLSSSNDDSDHHHEADEHNFMRKVDRNKRVNNDSDSDGNETHRSHHMEKRKSRRTEGPEMALDDDVGYDSEKNERKEAKRRRKEDKKLRKEERRRRREERHRKREERRAGKLNAKSVDTVTPPSDFEKKHNDTGDSDGDVAARRDSHPSDTEEMESEQKKLEIELRKKALESLRAKKAISH
ncbi:serine/arginine repetitive matrix protein 1-like protein [Cinnamomum micranthum f. kanehirae]|uniref:Serine/arginine repetitive matrix protein 1-like protein n=1 Tax=Cinnamomum micranthum f. kanehirae TaxID=337451 RepID=A0A3S3QL30_9MAGN|nr:serine/arginine repetitive matrix protein 1-like protein [Cinnamomum micranthum f. kanehirae]